MDYYYSAETRGFYIEGLHTQIPADAVSVTEEQHAALMIAQADGKTIAADKKGFPVAAEPPAPTLEQVKANKMAEIDSARDTALAAGFEYNGYRFDSDAASKQRINALVTLAMLNKDLQTPYITQDNQTIALSVEDIIGLGTAAAEYEGAIIFKARELKDKVLAATTEKNVEAIKW